MSNVKQYKTEFIEHLKGLIDYWLAVPDHTEKEKMEGLICSTLVAIDGEEPAVGPYILKPVIDDKGAKGPDIGGNLHDLFYNIKQPKTKAVKLPDRIVIAIDSAGVHIRKTVCVEHNDIKDLATYDAKRMFSIKNEEVRRQLLAIVGKHYPHKKKPRKFKKPLEIID